MRIAISADNKDGLDSVVSPHFGRCPHFVLVDVEGQEIKELRTIDNPYYGKHQPGQVPAFINSYDVNVMLTGGMGRRAIMFFDQFGVQPVTGAAGTVRQSLERYLGGTLEGAAPCRESVEHAHPSTGSGRVYPSTGSGQAGPSTGSGQAHHPTGSGQADVYERDEIGRLKEEADMLRRQLDEVDGRLDRLD